MAVNLFKGTQLSIYALELIQILLWTVITVNPFEELYERLLMPQTSCIACIVHGILGKVALWYPHFTSTIAV